MIRMVETDKLQGTALHQFMAEDSDKVIGVLIEPDLPQRYEVITRTNRDGMPMSVPVRGEPETDEEQEVIEKRVAEIQAELERLGASSRWLPSADSFLARVTPGQLRAIAQNPMIRAIWSNRELGVNVLSS